MIKALIAKFRRGCAHKDIENIAWLDHTGLRLIQCLDCGISIIEVQEEA